MKSKAIFHADHIGSLLRPKALKQAYTQFAEKTISLEILRAIEDEAIEKVVAKQQAIGLQSITDGEFRRTIYFGHFTAGCHGFTNMQSEIKFDEEKRSIKYNSPTVTGKISRKQSITGHEIDFVQQRLQKGNRQKVTLPSPADMHAFRYREGISDQANVYADLEEFFADIANVFQEELADLAARGIDYVQLDDTTFTLFCDPKWKKRFAERGYDPDEMVQRYVTCINAAIGKRPKGMTIAMHQCRGNNQGEWLFSGGYEAVAETTFSQLNIDKFFLEYDSERAGGFEPLRFLPKDKFVVLGLISSKSPQMEDKDTLKRKVEAAAKYFPMERMGISPQCGFASTAPGNPLTEDIQWKKLNLAIEISEELW